MNELDKYEKKNLIIVIALVIGLVGLIIISFLIGRYSISIEDIFIDSRSQLIITKVRFPRIVLAVLIGSSLSVAGSVYQGIFQNPMASPDILGASSGAALGAALGILLGFSNTMVTLCAFIFSILTIFVVLAISNKTKGKQTVGIILTGIVVSNLCSAGTSFIKLVADPTDELPSITYWLMGGLSGVTINEVIFVVPFLVIGLIPFAFLTWRMNILTLGEEQARTLGVNGRKLRILVILLATLVTSTCVSVSGLIGWVGLIIPNFARKLVGNDFRYLLPTTFLSGGVFLLIVDNVSRSLLETEIPLGILTAIIGAPFFLSLLMRKEEV